MTNAANESIRVETINEANARLISAAPELLTELEADEDASQLSFTQFFKKHGYNVTERGDRRRAAIAKAKGELE